MHMLNPHVAYDWIRRPCSRESPQIPISMDYLYGHAPVTHMARPPPPPAPEMQTKDLVSRGRERKQKKKFVFFWAVRASSDWALCVVCPFLLLRQPLAASALRCVPVPTSTATRSSCLGQTSDSHLDLIRAPYVLHGVKYIDLVSLGQTRQVAFKDACRQLLLFHTTLCVRARLCTPRYSCMEALVRRTRWHEPQQCPHAVQMVSVSAHTRSASTASTDRVTRL